MPAEVIETVLHGEKVWYARCFECLSDIPDRPRDAIWRSLFHTEDDALDIVELHNELHHTTLTKSAHKR